MKNYNNFSQTFAKSRKNMNWPEIQYFIEYIKKDKNFIGKELKILDIGCGSGRLLNFILKSALKIKYLGIDSSSGMIDEAKMEFPDYDFRVLGMIEMDKIEDKFDIIFFIASFHHLADYDERINVLSKAKKLLNNGGIIFMTNWNLLGESNFRKYEKSYKGKGDFQIKIGNYSRYYHSFWLDELNKLFMESGFTISENRIFEGGNNVVSILIKK